MILDGATLLFSARAVSYIRARIREWKNVGLPLPFIQFSVRTSERRKRGDAFLLPTRRRCKKELNLSSRNRLERAVAREERRLRIDLRIEVQQNASGLIGVIAM